MLWIKVYLTIFIPVAAAISMVYVHFYIKKKLRDLKKRRFQEWEKKFISPNHQQKEEKKVRDNDS